MPAKAAPEPSHIDPLPDLVPFPDSSATPPVAAGDGSLTPSPPEAVAPAVELPGRIPEPGELPPGEAGPETVPGTEAPKPRMYTEAEHNAEVSRALQKHQKEQAARELELKRLGQWNEYFGRLSPEQLLSAREDDRVDDIYRKVREWRRTGDRPTPTAKDVTTNVLNQMKSYYKENPEWSTIVADKWDDLAKEADPARFLTRLVDTGVEVKHRSTEAEIAKRVQAAVAEELAKHNLSPRGPSVPPGTQRGAGAVMTRQQYINLTQEQQNALSPAQVDALYDYWARTGS